MASPVESKRVLRNKMCMALFGLITLTICKVRAWLASGCHAAFFFWCTSFLDTFISWVAASSKIGYNNRITYSILVLGESLCSLTYCFSSYLAVVSWFIVDCCCVLSLDNRLRVHRRSITTLTAE